MRVDPLSIEHSVSELVRQRLFALALGCEDLNDHSDLRRDPLLATAVGKEDVGVRAGGWCERTIGLEGSQLAGATLGRVRLRLLKVAALVQVSFRRLDVALCPAFPLQDVFRLAASRLQTCAPPGTS